MFAVTGTFFQALNVSDSNASHCCFCCCCRTALSHHPRRPLFGQASVMKANVFELVDVRRPSNSGRALVFMSAEVHHIMFDFVRYFRHCVVSGPNSLYVFCYYLRFPCRTSTRRGVWISVQFRLQFFQMVMRFRVYGYFSTVYLASRAACGTVHANLEAKSSLSEFVSEVVFVLDFMRS